MPVYKYCLSQARQLCFHIYLSRAQEFPSHNGLERLGLFQVLSSCHCNYSHEKRVIETYINMNVPHISYWDKLLEEPMRLKQQEQMRSLHLCASTDLCSKGLENAGDRAPSLSRYPLLSSTGYCVPGSISRLSPGAGPLPAEFAVGVLSEVKEGSSDLWMSWMTSTKGRCYGLLSSHPLHFSPN